MDREQAKDYLKKSADAGEIKGMHSYAECAAKGEGCVEESKKQ